MSEFPIGARAITAAEDRAMRYSFCSLVTRPDQYSDMVESFRARGFGDDDCEFLYADNRADNSFDGYRGLNRLINAARGTYVILIHQDILAIDDRARLDTVLDALNKQDPDWAVVGNVGYTKDRNPVARMTSTGGIHDDSSVLPQRVETLDENFLLLRKDALVGFSHDLSGFHFYGTDLVQQARLRGHSAYVIDYHVEHLGLTEIDHDFVHAMDEFTAKYREALKPRLLRTTVTWISVGGDYAKVRRHRKRMAHRAAGTKPPFDIVAFRKRIKQNLRRRADRKADGRYELDGTVFQIPPNSPPAAVDAIRAGIYEKPERDHVAKYLPTDLPAIELGGSYGIVSYNIRKRLAPDTPLTVVEANPDLIGICRGNLALAAGGHSEVIHAALAYGQESVRFTVTEGLHTSYVTGTGLNPEEHPGREIEVPAVTLAGLIESQSINGPYSLICDIEGAEFDLFVNDTAALANCHTAIVEIHPEPFILRGESTSAFMALVASAGFEVVDQKANVLTLQRSPTV